MFEENMSEVLLSRPVIQILGFNLNDHLARLKTTKIEQNMEDVTITSSQSAYKSGTLSSLISKSLNSLGSSNPAFIVENEGNKGADIDHLREKFTSCAILEDISNTGDNEITAQFRRIMEELEMK